MQDDHHDGEDLSPDPIVLERLRTLVDRLGLVTASRLAPRTAAEDHRRTHGHVLRFGCCRASAQLQESHGGGGGAVLSTFSSLKAQ